MKIIKKWLIVIAGLLTSSAALADIAIIVNPVNSDVSLTRSNIQDIFMGMTQKLPNGAMVIPYDQGDQQPVRQQFYLLVAGKSPVQMKNYWSRLIFTGKGSPPRSLGDGNSILALVAKDKNAIGYVDANSAKNDSNVSVVFIIPT